MQMVPGETRRFWIPQDAQARDRRSGVQYGWSMGSHFGGFGPHFRTYVGIESDVHWGYGHIWGMRECVSRFGFERFSSQQGAEATAMELSQL